MRVRQLDIGHSASSARELGQRQRPHGGFVHGIGARGRDFGEQRDALLGDGWLLVGAFRGGRRRGRELGVALAQKGYNLAVLRARGVLGVRQEREEAVSALEGRGDESRARVVLVAPEAGADEIFDRVGGGPLRPHGC